MGTCLLWPFGMAFLTPQMPKKNEKLLSCVGSGETALQARQGEIFEESASHHCCNWYSWVKGHPSLFFSSRVRDSVASVDSAPIHFWLVFHWIKLKWVSHCSLNGTGIQCENSKSDFMAFLTDIIFFAKLAYFTRIFDLIAFLTRSEISSERLPPKFPNANEFEPPNGQKTQKSWICGEISETARRAPQEPSSECFRTTVEVQHFTEKMSPAEVEIDWNNWN